MKTLATLALFALGVEFQLLTAQSAAIASPRINIGYVDARPILETLRDDLLPAELKTLTPGQRESAWPDWVSRHDSTIRRRLDLGDEDSVVNFLLFGTTFTKRTRATERDLAQLAGGGDPPELVAGRIDDLLVSLESAGNNERLQFVREMFERKGIDPAIPEGKAQIQRHLRENLMRMSGEIEVFSERRLNDPSLQLDQRLTRFRDRGLSSDTSIFIDFAIEQTLQALKSSGAFSAGSIRRVAIVGPGLDFTDKHEGHDFYPQQTIQPFAAIDSLIRLGLARPDDVRLTTFDLSPRVNRHLENARRRAENGDRYVLQLPQSLDPPWTPPLAAYWQRLGDQIGDPATPAAVPPGAGRVRVRAVSVRPPVVASITPQDLNIVLQRLEPLPANERFDLVIATNVLAYYDVFEQSLALVNVSKMVRPGGMLLTNNGVFDLPVTPMAWVGNTDVTYMSVPGIGDMIDRVFWYRRD